MVRLSLKNLEETFESFVQGECSIGVSFWWEEHLRSVGANYYPICLQSSVPSVRDGLHRSGYCVSSKDHYRNYWPTCIPTLSLKCAESLLQV
jgi:hypothetical protein